MRRRRRRWGRRAAFPRIVPGPRVGAMDGAPPVRGRLEGSGGGLAGRGCAGDARVGTPTEFPRAAALSVPPFCGEDGVFGRDGRTVGRQDGCGLRMSADIVLVKDKNAPLSSNSYLVSYLGFIQTFKRNIIIFLRSFYSRSFTDAHKISLDFRHSNPLTGCGLL